MPVAFGLERDPHRWQRAMDLARTRMLAAGWIERSKKFMEVRNRKAWQIYATL